MEPGSWTDHGAIGLPANTAYNRIDPNWITIEGKHPLKISSVIPHPLAYNARLNHREEASFMVQHRNYYNVLFSGGIASSYTANYPAAGEEYRIHMCHSTSGTGAFVDKASTLCLKSGGTILLASHEQVYAPGGQEVAGIINDKDLGLILYY
ncbi:uncharacterized protein N7482_010745 [Penicillium canariense]|uniref:Uncharacterized protein n=1 Tax=Penicillium canariense TaxID=189055 RepID=A0A9W9LEK1_9EURO|nr:uncharacterized protein N7482_010745 [Penicillium canariense]KAJ5151493.1 hypothetical protein N7482_010745 [Penicillium canariense]